MQTKETRSGFLYAIYEAMAEALTRLPVMISSAPAAQVCTSPCVPALVVWISILPWKSACSVWDGEFFYCGAFCPLSAVGDPPGALQRQ